MAARALLDSEMMDSPSIRDGEDEPKFGGFTRFEIELEFVQCLANPHYLQHLATLSSSQSLDPTAAPTTLSMPLLQTPSFVAYLSYLRYFSQPPYLKYLTYPGPTLKNLDLLQSERFRREIISPEVVARMVLEGSTATAGN